MNRFVIALLAVAASTLSATAQAAPITYSFTGRGSYSFNGSFFSNQNFSFSFVGDTNNVFAFDTGVDAITTFSSATVTLGATPFSITDDTGVFVNRNASAIGILTDGDALVFGSFFPGSDTYDLRTAFGPTAPLAPFATQGAPIDTSGGQLAFESVSTNTFQAALGGVSAPEPTSLALFALPAVGVVVRRKRLQK